MVKRGIMVAHTGVSSSSSSLRRIKVNVHGVTFFLLVLFYLWDPQDRTTNSKKHFNQEKCTHLDVFPRYFKHNVLGEWHKCLTIERIVILYRGWPQGEGCPTTRIHTSRIKHDMFGKPNTKGFPLLKTQGKFTWRGAFQPTCNSFTYATKTKGIPTTTTTTNQKKKKKKRPLLNNKISPGIWSNLFKWNGYKRRILRVIKGIECLRVP